MASAKKMSARRRPKGDKRERTRAALPRATLARIPDCSHFPFLEAPEVLIALLGPFLEGPGEPSEPESDLRRST